MSAAADRPIPGQTSTGSKRAEALFGGLPGPRAMVRSDGCRVWDETGRPLIDMGMALGAVALGYGHPAVVAAVADGAENYGLSEQRMVLAIREHPCGGGHSIGEIVHGGDLHDIPDLLLGQP